MIELICETCGKPFEVWNYRKDTAKTCSLDCRPQAFKKGFVPWNKNKPGYSTSRKGKKYPQFSKENCHLWKGGIKISYGYILISKPNHPFCNKQNYVRQHRLVMEEIIGRYLLPEERVHHKGIKYPISSIENKQDNRPENLKYFSNEAEHQKFHAFLRKHQSERHK